MYALQKIAAAGCVSLLSMALTGAGLAQTPENNTEVPPLSAEHEQSNLPNVIVIATGGTIAGEARDGNQVGFQSYRAGTYLMADMLEDLPAEELIADVAALQFGNRGSGGYRIVDLYDLSQTVDAALAIYDGVVVTTGTDTMEEIAYFLDLTVQSEKPVVITGAMRPWDVIGTDGPANLYNAIRTAASNQTYGFGTVLMLNDEIHAAREVTKGNSHRLDTFVSPMVGMLGFIDDRAISIYRTPPRALLTGTDAWQTPFDLTRITADDLPIVDVVYNYQQAGGGAIRGLVEDGAAGIVTAGTGAGGISSAMGAARTEAIANGVIFVSTTRTGSGAVIDSGQDGIIGGNNLNAAHARMLLLLSLAFSDDIDTIRGWFTSFGAADPGAALN